MAEPTISELIAELSRSGLLLNNLFQLDDGRWRSSVREIKSMTGFHFYDHPNPGAAVLGAIEVAKHSMGTPLRKNVPRTAKPSLTASSGADLLALLGLKKSPPA